MRSGKCAAIIWGNVPRVPEKHEGRIYDTVVYSDYIWVYIYMYEMSNRKNMKKGWHSEFALTSDAWCFIARSGLGSFSSTCKGSHPGSSGPVVPPWDLSKIADPKDGMSWHNSTKIAISMDSFSATSIQGLYDFVWFVCSCRCQPWTTTNSDCENWGGYLFKIVIYFKYFNFHRSKWTVNPHQKLDIKSADPLFMKSYGSRDY